MIARQIKEKLRATIAQVPAVVLLGARQVGKTTLAKNLADDIESVYLDLEAPEDLLKLSDPTSFLSLHADRLVILDEIQRSPELFPVLRGLIDKNRERGRRVGQFLLLGSAVYQLGCATYSQQAVSMRDNLLVGRVDLAKMTAEKQDEDEDDVLACLNKGMLRRMTHDYAGSNQIFEAAKQQIDLLYGLSISGTATSLTISDVLRDYKGARYEQILLHAYMAMNYLQLGDLDSARVEILQADVKMMEWGAQPDEDPFVRYIAGIIFEALGEYDQALVSYRKARDGYLASRSGATLGVPSILKKDLLRLLAMQGLTNEYRRLKAEFDLTDYKPASVDDNVGEVIVILSNGLAPIVKRPR